ncbi:MAG: 4-hydroxybenzoyl-CoA reductase subunit beta, partial [Gammaproteobacteria bacterium]|nr:4-hydroxybenzoyl-CoA reductase subunit beta [Gammaproteobacteria bacterium]
PATAARCAYAKERVRGSFDFPLAGVAVALSIDGARLTALQVAATGVSSWPVLVTGTAALIGRAIDDSLLAEVDKLVQKQVRPMRTTLTQSHYRRLAAAALARRLVAALGAAEGGKS